MKKYITGYLLTIFSITQLSAQTVLQADKQKDTYELITSVLAPNANPIETPDCAHEEFGRHIDQVFDNTLNKDVFRFHIHVAEDNDRCKKFDRQRNEIKTYKSSPDNLKGTQGETVIYEWKFKLDKDFQVSSHFTHLHQLKAVGGSEDKMPMFTLTARKASPDKLELRYARNLTQETLTKTDLTTLKGKWVKVTEAITYGEKGQYDIKITRIEDNKELLSYSSTSIRTWKTDAEFIRPKWGIYRSLNEANSLRNEQLLFADFSIKEENMPLQLKKKVVRKKKYPIYPNPVSSRLFIADEKQYKTIGIYDSNGKLMISDNVSSKDSVDVSRLPNGTYFLVLQAEKGKTDIMKLQKR